MKPLPFVASLALAPLLAACGHLSPSRAALTATGYVSHQLCSAMFLAGQEPTRHYREAIAPLAGSFESLVRYSVDRDRAEVRASIAGLAENRACTAPSGCVNAPARH